MRYELRAVIKCRSIVALGIPGALRKELRKSKYARIGIELEELEMRPAVDQS